MQSLFCLNSHSTLLLSNVCGPGQCWVLGSKGQIRSSLEYSMVHVGTNAALLNSSGSRNQGGLLKEDASFAS